jgi:uncharacterized membrane protein
MRSALLVQTNGRGFWLCVRRSSSIARSSSGTLLNAPRRIRRSVIWAKNRSTWLSHDELVGGEVRDELGVPGEPLPDPRVLVRPVVVHHHVDRRPRLADEVRVEAAEDGQELLVPVPPVALPDHLPGGDVQGREQGRGAVPDVVVGGLLRPVGQEGLRRLGAVEWLDLGLLVHAHDEDDSTRDGEHLRGHRSVLEPRPTTLVARVRRPGRVRAGAQPDPPLNAVHDSWGTPGLAILIGGLLPAVFLGLSRVLQKTASRTGIAPGPYVLITGLVVAAVGGIVTLAQRDTTVTASGAIQTAGFAVLWSTAILGIMLGLGRYEGQVSVIVPLYNMNTLVAVAIGLVLLGEWQDVNLRRLLTGAALIVAGGVLAGTSVK